MTTLPVPLRWLIGLLGAVFLVDFLLAVAAGSPADALALPGGAVVLGCVYLAVFRPGWATAGGAAVLVGSSWLVRRVGAVPRWVGVEGLLVSETLGGGAIVLLLAWRARAGVAVAGITGLVLAGLAATVVRAGALPGQRSMSFGLAILLIGVAVGIYLRRSGQRTDSELHALVRRQWPLMAVLVVLLLFDIGAVGDNPRALALGGAVVAAGCAFFAPRDPVRAALAAAAAIGAAALASIATTAAEFLRPWNDTFVTVWIGPGRTPFSFAQLAASMALVGFVVRYARPQPAAWGTAALAMANLGPVLVTPGLVGVDGEYLAPQAVLLASAVVAGWFLRVRDRERQKTVRVAVTGVRQAERMALARELHDVVAHHVTGILVQAQAARLVAQRDPGVVVGALEKIESSGAEALVAMRTLVGSLRGAQPAGGSTAPAQATTDLAADIRALVDRFTGPTVHLELSLPETLPHEMGRTVLRVVQESLTNVSKHAAGATSVRVEVGTGRGDLGDELHVFVKDDGTARRSGPAGGSDGYGLIGMRERVELLGGRLVAGPGADGGWVVKVALPLRSGQ
ncbi:MAG TPA: histidine kinase [Actinophytocola sp.]|uniref:sensor histidine kinase n=1 Tax=Actinophytocola sp. TaxID=1872138 RepID=UPI002DDCCB2B|nr:histidine kinase [Actinophytocola sp.]HEV2781820.1 histidine kinase [Actinophytocola sp.]